MKPSLSQPGILAAPLPVGRSLVFRFAPGADVAAALKKLRKGFSTSWGVMGVGEPLVRALGRKIPGLRAFPEMTAPAGHIPSTQQALWLFLRNRDRTATFDATLEIRSLVAGAFVLDDAMDTFLYAGGKDLSGYEDGTENPRRAAAIAAALISSGKGLAGSSFVAVQRWAHDLQLFQSLPRTQRNAIIGRRADTNAEIATAPASAHVKRSAQESYDPPSFMLRRSMPWAAAHEQGLEFIAYVESLDRFERVLRRMAGLDDGVVDGLFTFSRPLTGGYYWCPPVTRGRLNLSCLGL